MARACLHSVHLIVSRILWLSWAGVSDLGKAHAKCDWEDTAMYQFQVANTQVRFVMVLHARLLLDMYIAEG